VDGLCYLDSEGPSLCYCFLGAHFSEQWIRERSQRSLRKKSSREAWQPGMRVDYDSLTAQVAPVSQEQRKLTV
jgi:hypothetical protein